MFPMNRNILIAAACLASLPESLHAMAVRRTGGAPVVHTAESALRAGNADSLMAFRRGGGDPDGRVPDQSSVPALACCRDVCFRPDGRLVRMHSRLMAARTVKRRLWHRVPLQMDWFGQRGDAGPAAAPDPTPGNFTALGRVAFEPDVRATRMKLRCSHRNKSRTLIEDNMTTTLEPTTTARPARFRGAGRVSDRLFDPEIALPAIGESLKKLNPLHMVKNPVMFVTEVGAAVTTGELFFAKAHGEPFGFVLQICLWLLVYRQSSPTLPRRWRKGVARRRPTRCARAGPRPAPISSAPTAPRKWFRPSRCERVISLS